MLRYGKKLLTAVLALAVMVALCGLVPTQAAAAIQSSEVLAQQVSLGDDLTMNFVVNVAEDNRDGTLTASVAGKEVSSSVVNTLTADADGYYPISVELAAAQMTDTVNLTLTDGDDTVFTRDYSVQSYAHALLAENSSYSDAVKTMAKSMLNYGAAAQVYFAHNTDDLANADYVTDNTVDLSAVEAPAVEATGTVDGLSFYGASLVFRGKVAVRYYFEAPNGVADFTFSVGENTYAATQKGDYYYVEVPGITPENYGKAVTMTAGTADNKISVSYSPMSYLVRMYGKTENEDLKTLLQAMYGYHEAAVAYLAQDDQDSEVELPYSPVFYSMYQYEEFIGNAYPVSLGTLFGTDDTVNDNAVIEVSVETISGTATGVYNPEFSASGWSSNTIQFSGTGKVKITVNNAAVELTVENTSYTYPYNHNYPTFSPMYTSEQYYIGNATEKLGDLFMTSDMIDEASVVTLKAVIPDGSNASVTYSEDFAAANWYDVELTFSGTGAVELSLNGGTPLTLVVENTDYDYPYTHNTPSFSPVDMTKNLIGNATVSLGKLFYTYSEVNQASVIDVTVTCMSDTVTAEYTPAAEVTKWEESTITFSGTGDVQISINSTSLTLTVEKTSLNEPYQHTYPIFTPNYGEGYYIGNQGAVSLGTLYSTSETVDETAIIDVVVESVDGSSASGSYTANTTDWTQGTIQFSGTGAVKITVNGKELQLTVDESTNTAPYIPSVVKFATKFTNDYLYRVGNGNAVGLGYLFEEITEDAVVDSGVQVTVERVDETMNVSGTYTANTTDWTQGTIKFTGTGVVKLTIDDQNTCIPTELYLEVINANNATTSVLSATGSDVVLLQSLSGTFSVSGGYTFYGNGFTVTLPTDHATSWSSGVTGYVNLNGGNLDNVQIIGPVYPVANIYRQQAGNETDGCTYFRNSVIILGGDCTITNSYISGSRAALYIKDGDKIVVENTTVSGGAYANIEVSVADSVVFRDLTTEQKETPDSYNADDAKKMMIGLGIVIDNAATDVYLEGSLNQYNWITEAQWEAMLGSYANQFPDFFGDSTYEEYWHYRPDDSTKYVNLTLIFGCDWDSTKLHDNRSVQTPLYVTKNITVATMTGAAYSVSGAGTLTDELLNAAAYLPSDQYAVAPDFAFDYLSKNYEAKTDESNNSCYYDSTAGVVKMSFDEGGSRVWDAAILTVTKNSHALSYDVKVGSTAVGSGVLAESTASYTFDTAGDYLITYSYTDPYNYKLDGEGNVVTYSKTYEETITVSVTEVEAAVELATFVFGPTGATKESEKFQVGNDYYLSAVGVDASTLTNSASATYAATATATSSTPQTLKYDSSKTWASVTIDGNTYYFPVVSMGTTDGKFEHTGSWVGCFPVFKGAVTITDPNRTGSPFGEDTTTLPDTLAAVNPQLTFRHSGTLAKVPTTPSTQTKGTYSGVLCYTTQTDLTASNERDEEWILARYTYTDAKNTYYWFVAYYCAASTNGGGCVTPDTLVTLADGSQKRVDSLTGEEMLLVWNHQTGSLDSAPVAYIVNHDEVVREQEIVHLTFSDGNDIKIIGEHVFFDATLNKYVALTAENAADYIGHSFVTVDSTADALNYVKLTNVERYVEETAAYEVVSYKHLTCFTNNVLSTSAYLDKLLNIFDIVPETMAYSAELVQKDIETYGLYTYADFEDLISEEAFELYNAAYLKVAVGKGYITWDDILELIDIYFDVDVQPIQ